MILLPLPHNRTDGLPVKYSRTGTLEVSLGMFALLVLVLVTQLGVKATDWVARVMGQQPLDVGMRAAFL